MPEDKRLWMTFPIDFWMHPKFAPLSDSAKITFVEMNGYSRIHDLDGRIPVKTAKALWKPRAIAELQSNHPKRPTLTVVDDEFVIRDYAKHQQTRAAREAAAATARENGKLGGRPRNENPDKTQGVTQGVSKSKPRTNPNQTQTKAESESESENYMTDVTNLDKSSHLGDAETRGHDIPESVLVKARKAGITNLPAMITALTNAVGKTVTPAAAIELALATTARARGHVRNVDKYVGSACRKSPEDIIWDYERLDLGALP